MTQDDHFLPEPDAAGAGMAPHPAITPPAEAARDLSEQMHGDEMVQDHQPAGAHKRQYRLRDPGDMR
ncbi:MAG TPA: hypothetical protein VGD77_01450 [Gemmatimonadaceae bacterium]